MPRQLLGGRKLKGLMGVKKPEPAWPSTTSRVPNRADANSRNSSWSHRAAETIGHRALPFRFALLDVALFQLLHDAGSESHGERRVGFRSESVVGSVVCDA